MKAFHGDKAIKAKYLARVKAHRIADEIVKGKYWEEGKGCAVGCTVHSAEHLSYETELGLPEWLAHVEDVIFEGLPNSRAKLWPEQFLRAINVGASFEQVKIDFIVFVLESSLESMDKAEYDEAANPDVKKAIAHSKAAVIEMIRCHKERLDLSASWSASWSAASAAWSASESVAWSASESESAAWSASESAAWSASESAESVARSAESAAWSASESVARSAAYVKFADELLKLLKNTK